MRSFFHDYLVPALLFSFFIAPIWLTPALAANDKIVGADKSALLGVVESSCKKSCVKGQKKQAFCSVYCGCVRGQLTQLTKQTDLSKILQNSKQQNQIIQHCSGETGIKFFSKSCQQSCNGAPKCKAYCSCLEAKITDKKNVSEIGAFFIQLGKNNTSAINRLKGFEAACTP